MDTLFLWHIKFFLHANIERVNGGFVGFSPFNSTLEMQQVMGDFVRLYSRVGVLGAKKISAIRSTKNVPAKQSVCKSYMNKHNFHDLQSQLYFRNSLVRVINYFRSQNNSGSLLNKI